MPFKKKHQTEINILAILLVVVILLFSARIYFLQVVNANAFKKTLPYGAASSHTATIKAPRGEILDCYGRQIAVNRDGYNIVFNKAYVKDNLNSIILTLINDAVKYQTEWVDILPISTTAPYIYKEGEKTDKLLKKLDLANYATAQNCFDEMVTRYKLENYTKDEQRKIMGVRYSMEISDFSISYPFTFAEDIPTEFMRKVSETNFTLQGVSIDVVPFREYSDTTLAVNLIGAVGPIFEEDWETYKEKGYSYNDKVGKSGIEKWGEEYLRGIDGQITYYLSAKGEIIKSKVTKEPIAGKTIMLSLDKNIQRLAQDSLAAKVKDLRSRGSSCRAATAVAIDIKTGKVLAAANYPTYDSATMNKDYNQLAADPTKPLMDRAFQGIYPIGSTIKPGVSVAALETGVYNNGETVRCVQTYSYFDDYKPKCLHHHGSINLKTAISKSCNYFFFEMGRRIGATTLTDYFKQFGLGVKTGVEVNDSAGLLLQPSSDRVGGTTLQISIGQMNAFTPLQLANYTATLANGGNHYKVSLINQIVSYDMSETIMTVDPEIKNTVKISANTLAAVKDGMLSVTEEGTGRQALSDYPIKVGGKTGTSQVNNKEDNGVFVAFAPFDNPQIAVAVILENGGHGSNAGPVVRDILDAYFFSEQSADKVDFPFTVLD